jgi:hypothetical protein
VNQQWQHEVAQLQTTLQSTILEAQHKSEADKKLWTGNIILLS